MKTRIENLALDAYTHSKIVRNLITKSIDKRIHKSIVESDSENLTAVQQKKYDYLSALLYSIKRNIDKNYISNNFIKKTGAFISSLEVSMVEDKDPARDNSTFVEKYGMDPPMFIVLSPTQKCNLNCTGCYAGSRAATAPSIPFETVDKIVEEVHDSFNGRFITISGGEPFMYSDNGKTLIDIFEKYNDMFFLVYTNGTFFTKELSKRLEELGNVTPAISVEGYKEHTDKRRGKGVHQKIMKGFENLRNAGVPFGVSVTATSENVDVLLEEAFYDYYFEEQGATYMWQFQFMPIGKGNEVFDLVVQPDERVKMYRMWERMLKEKNYSIADFWNSGVLTHGCIAYGANRGYIYIDWNGNIMPCVFVPFYVDNVFELYSKGKSIGDALHSEFMKRGNNWQKEYGLNNKSQPGNWLMPCSIRDHFKDFRENILTKDAVPENQEAASIMNKDYYEKMIRYDQKLEKLTSEIWEKEYLR
ncbi:MAG: radical SAM protein [Bacteroidales bacterium]|nr:radical SAM protein [Bacteroidales bacterium]MCF8399302.1 radical SAM protein [Bacteroidales bacterium]